MLPYLKSGGETARQYTVAFGGIHWGEDHAEGDLEQCENLSTRCYPCLAQSGGRTAVGSYPEPGGMTVAGELLVIHGTQVVWGGKTVGEVMAGRKQTAVMGDYVLIFPDKVFFNTADGVFGSMEASVTVTDAVFADSTISAAGVDFPFREGDAVTVSGCTAGENDRTVILRGVERGVLRFYDNTFTACSGQQVTLSRQVPDLDFLCESNYRLWGVRGSTIYASKYGDPFNFSVFDGLSGDSYRIDVAGEGAFTGCIPYSGHICFFKEHTLHKLYGSKPGNYQLVTSRVCGVQAGSEGSLCVVNETLYYKGADGVYAYTGGVPELISGNFGARRFRNACAAGDGSRYYLSMEGEDGWHLMTYDVYRGIWLREDALACAAMVRHGDAVYLLDADGTLWRTGADEAAVRWSAVFRPFTETVLNRKGYSRFLLRLELAEGAWLEVQVRRDDQQAWETVHTARGGRARTVSVPVLPARCDRVQLRLSGQGQCLVRTLVREFTVGSDV